jgi:hypothetical protein
MMAFFSTIPIGKNDPDERDDGEVDAAEHQSIRASSAPTPALGSVERIVIGLTYAVAGRIFDKGHFLTLLGSNVEIVVKTTPRSRAGTMGRGGADRDSDSTRGANLDRFVLSPLLKKRSGGETA